MCEEKYSVPHQCRNEKLKFPFAQEEVDRTQRRIYQIGHPRRRRGWIFEDCSIIIEPDSGLGIMSPYIMKHRRVRGIFKGIKRLSCWISELLSFINCPNNWSTFRCNNYYDFFFFFFDKKLDLKSSYHKIRVQLKEVIETAFRTYECHYNFLAVLYNLSNVLSSFNYRV